jgi:ribonucleoside-triphosphate reductase
MDILDICNWLGTVLSSRRSAEIALMEYGSDEWEAFATAKKHCFEPEFKHRQQSNNSLVFYQKPSREQLEEVFQLMIDSGGSEPGFVNGAAAIMRAPWFKGLNPCAEILLGNKSFCNLVELDLAKFGDDMEAIHKAITILARANYRQTIVDFRDGVLQESWHLNNEHLRLCGVSLTGIAQFDHRTEYEWKNIRYSAVTAARGMAAELKLEYPKNVTTGKPSGTLSKIMDTWEGIHKPDGQYVFNWINFSNHDPIVEKLKIAGYDWMINPSDPTGTIVCIPVQFSDEDSYFTKVKVQRNDGSVEVLSLNTEDAITQLDRYKKLQMYYCDQNMSNTIYYKPEEKEAILDWFMDNWDVYVGVSFLFKQDGTMSAKDLGYPYLPQEYVSVERYEDYALTLKDIDWGGTGSVEELEADDCASGVCPVK